MFCATVGFLLMAAMAVAAERPPGPAPVVNPVKTSDVFSRAMQQRVANATVRVVKASGSYGTGTIIGRSGSGRTYLILTACHCITDGGDIGIDVHAYAHGRDPGYVLPLSRQIEVACKCPSSDLALLRLTVDSDTAMPEPIRICPPSLRPTPPFAAFSLGCNTGTPSLQMTQVTETYSAVDLAGAMWLIADPTAHGRSGGPLIDERGLLVGVCCRFGPDQRGVYQGLDQIYACCDGADAAWLYGGEEALGSDGWDIALVLLKIVVGKILIVRFTKESRR